MKPVDEDDLRLEIRELTELLREDGTFEDVRQVLGSKGLNPDGVVLAGMVEGEDESCYGVVVASGLRCSSFEIGGDGALRQWEAVERIEDLREDFEALPIAIDMVRGGELK